MNHPFKTSVAYPASRIYPSKTSVTEKKWGQVTPNLSSTEVFVGLSDPESLTDRDFRGVK